MESLQLAEAVDAVESNMDTIIAIVSADRCKPRKCRLECKKFCPVVRTGKPCVDTAKDAKVAIISEKLCIACGLCVKKCPFEAIEICKLPRNIVGSMTHRYGPNSFQLHQLPVPRPGQVLGLVGANGTGKSTSLCILAGKLRPNLGRCDSDSAPDFPDIVSFLSSLHGKELQSESYFQDLVENRLVAMIKPQHIDRIPKNLGDTTVGACLNAKNDRGQLEKYVSDLDLGHLENRSIRDLSGGELQRFAIAMLCIQQAVTYCFDEPSTYLDVVNRHAVARSIRSLLREDNYVVVAEHDLSVLSHASDLVCCLWGKPGAYGVVSTPLSVHAGINNFLDGFEPTDKMRFRDVSLTFQDVRGTYVVVCHPLPPDAEGNTLVECKTLSGETLVLLKPPSGDDPLGNWLRGALEEVLKSKARHLRIMDVEGQLIGNPSGALQYYGEFSKTMGGAFKLAADAGHFTDGEITVMLGQNGVGKTTFLRILAGLLKPDGMEDFSLSRKVSYKPQTIGARFEGTLQELFLTKIKDAISDPQFHLEVVKPLQVDELMEFDVQIINGGALQRTALVLALGRPADVYLIDEPFAYLDVEQQVMAAHVIRQFFSRTQKVAVVVEHNFMLATYLADKVVVFNGTPGVACTATSPTTVLEGMNRFLQQLQLTFRQDPSNCRPLMNKVGSATDQEQKLRGDYFVLEE